MIGYEAWLESVKEKHEITIDHASVLAELHDILAEKTRQLIRKQFENYEFVLLLETIDRVNIVMAEEQKAQKFESEGIAEETPKKKRGRKPKDLN